VRSTKTAVPEMRANLSTPPAAAAGPAAADAERAPYAYAYATTREHKHSCHRCDCATWSAAAAARSTPERRAHRQLRIISRFQVCLFFNSRSIRGRLE
jgi:hypothetical protein